MAKRTSKTPATPNVVQGGSKWLAVHYAPVSLFSLRSTLSTSKGGKTLVIPTPYSIKLALIDACFRFSSADEKDGVARALFDSVKAKKIRIRPPQHCVVQNTFVKIRQAERALSKKNLAGDANDEDVDDSVDTEKGSVRGMYTSTIAYREMVYYSGEMTIAIEAGELSPEACELIKLAAVHVNHFGKRGSFFQYQHTEEWEALPLGFTIADRDTPIEIPRDTYGMSQFLDDFGPELVKAKDGFERISTYHHKAITMGKHRILVQTLVPYRQAQATRNFTRYERHLMVDIPAEGS